jgi:membrane metallo-endopeptidase-like protein 1
MQREPTNTPLLLPDSRPSYNRWLAVLIGILLITTIIFAALFGVAKSKTTTLSPPITTTTTSSPSTTTTTTSSPSTTTTATSSSPPPTTTSFDDNLCLTPYCIKAADYLLDSIDQTVNPCEDFYHFACGTWLKNARIPEDSGVQNIFNLLDTQLDINLIDLLSTPSSNETIDPQAVVNARNLYSSCTNETTIEMDDVTAVISIVNNELGGWPILQGAAWNSSVFNLTDLLLKLRQYDNEIIFSVVTGTDQQNSSAYDIELGQGSLGLEDTEYYNNETAIEAAYRQFMIDLATLLTNNTSAIQADVQDIYAFEKNISQYHWSAAEQTIRDNETIRATVGNLSEALKSNFDFASYLRQSYLIGNVTLKDTDVVSVTEVAYLVNVSSIIQQYPIRVVQNYLIWRFMMNRASSMPRRIRSTREQFDRVFKGTSAEPTRATTCANYVNDNMGFAVSRLYIGKYFDDNARNQSKDIINNIRNSMIDLIQGADWMDADSKAKAVVKEQAIYENIGYPDYIAGDNTTQLEEMYKEYVFNQSYINNALLMQRVKAREDFRTLEEVVDHRAWGDLPPTVVNAFYEPSTNAISFPAGILQAPYFNKDAPKYLNYGGIGMVSGHEITHGFDDDGRQYDKDGNRIPWWSNSTITQFNLRKQCIIDQYSNYTVEQIHKNLNGEQTQGENIADNGGIKSSFYAYQNWVKANPNVDLRLPGLSNYSQEQMFFIGYAHGWCAKFTDAYANYRVLTDVHSIPQFRVLGPLSNFKEFDRVFGCTPGQGDSRVDKCTVW